MSWFARFRRERPQTPTAPALSPAEAPSGLKASRAYTPPTSVPPRTSREPRFVVLDVETTGLSASTHRVVELALVTTDPTGRVVDEWSTRFNPQGPVGATHIHGITDADVKHAPLFADVVDQMSTRLSGAAVVAHNAPFDLAFLRAEYARASWRLPYLPTLCTLDASQHHLPHLPRRRLVDCCDAIGHPLTHAHSALGDAHATAALLAYYLNPRNGSHAHPDHLRMPHDALTVPWPTGPDANGVPLTDRRRSEAPASRRDLSERARRNVEALNLNVTRPAQPLVQLVERFSLLDALDEGAPAGALAYLEKIAEVLEDGVLTPDEAADLHDVAAVHDLDADAVAAAHRAFVLALAHEALEDGKVSRAEADELRIVAALLDVSPNIVKSLLADAETARHARLSAGLGPLPAGWAHGEPLRVGDRVVFTGCENAGRGTLEARSEELGVRVLGTVSSKTAMLVTDGTMLGGKHDKATALGVRMVDPETYRTLLAHLQPALPAAKPVVKTLAPGNAPTRTTAEPSGAMDALTAPANGFAVPGSAAPTPSPALVRAWGRDNGWQVGQRGRLPAGLLEAYNAAAGG
ncbi:exonuclease domain-containing protein [Nocardioides zeicaulis]